MKKYFLGLLSLFCITQTVLAHPHSFVDMKNQVLITDDTLKGFAMSWMLDEITSAELLYEINRAENKPEAIKKITDELSTSAIEAHYFSEFYNEKNEPIKFKAKPINPSVEIQKNRIIYHFELTLAKPQALKGHSFRLYTFEPSYYLSMSYDNASDVTVTHQSICKVSMEEPQVNDSLRLYASSLDKTETPDMPTTSSLSLGAMFSQKVNIVCQ